MKFNPSECHAIQITKRKTPAQYILDSIILETVTSANFFGVTISDNFTWNNYTDNITRKTNQT